MLARNARKQVADERMFGKTSAPTACDNAAMARQGVFVFADDGVEFYSTAEDAARDMEGIDVRDGVYEAVFTLDGERLFPQALDEIQVRLERSGQVDIDLLRTLLVREKALRTAFMSDPRDTVAVANELLALRWSVRWPRWPRWLDRRLHGTEPPTIGTD